MNTKNLACSLVAIAAALASASPLLAAVSPHETIKAEIDGANISIAYGRPYTVKPGTTEARKIWGGLVPWGKVWRLGADQATVLTTDQPLVLGGFNLPAGKYSLFLVPDESGTSKLVINKKTGQWGIPYNEASEKDNELARVDAKKESVDKAVDQFTMAIEKGSSGGGVITMTWEKTQFSVPFTVKK